MSFDKKDFPNLTPENHRVTSPATDVYNCIAWAVGREECWYEHVAPYHWPAGLPRDYLVNSLLLVLEHEGFVACDDMDLEGDTEKVAIFADSQEYMHAALQLPSGKWTSKMGAGEDIEHDTLEDVAGPGFGQVVRIMKRTRRSSGS